MIDKDTAVNAPEISKSKLNAALEAMRCPIMDKKNITKEITPLDVVGVRIAQIIRSRAYCNWVPQWAWDMYRSDAQTIASELRKIGITDDMVRDEVLRQASR